MRDLVLTLVFSIHLPCDTSNFRVPYTFKLIYETFAVGLLDVSCHGSGHWFDVIFPEICVRYCTSESLFARTNFRVRSIF